LVLVNNLVNKTTALNVFLNCHFISISETNVKPTTTENYIGPQKTIRKQCFPLYSLLLALGNPTVDYLSLDVEGTELGILKTIPWDKVNYNCWLYQRLASRHTSNFD
jgi:hypothetical protein